MTGRRIVLAVVALVVVAAIVGVLVVAAAKPDSFRVERRIRVDAAPQVLYPLVADFHRWAAWSPYEKLDPAMQKTFGGAASGPGAVYEWNGSGKAGAGRMEITEAQPPSLVRIKLDFIKPFEGHNVAEFSFVPQGSATEVTWAMSGRAPFISKLMQVFLNLDTMVGKDFEAGLANLKAMAEQPVR